MNDDDDDVSDELKSTRKHPRCILRFRLAAWLKIPKKAVDCGIVMADL